MTNLTTFQDVLKELEKDPEFAERQADAKPSRDAAMLLVHARLALGLTQTQFARNAGVSQAYISSLESGASNPSLRSFARVLRKNGVELRLDTAFMTKATGDADASDEHPDASTPIADTNHKPVDSSARRSPSRKKQSRLSA